jgi:5-methylcytosine-specific restriction endonuclease McrA
MSPLVIRGKKTGKPAGHLEILWRYQYMRCHYCNRVTIKGREDRACSYTATIEHVLPRSRGGKNAIENKVVSCDRCNTVRNLIEQRLRGQGRWTDIDIPADLFVALLPVDIDRWEIYNREMLNAVIEAMRWGVD